MQIDLSLALSHAHALALGHRNYACPCNSAEGGSPQIDYENWNVKFLFLVEDLTKPKSALLNVSHFAAIYLTF